jgi:hypothetical protein
MNLLKTCLAVFLGFLLAVAIYHPKAVNGAGTVDMRRATEGLNYVSPTDVIGFSCTSNQCYVLVK